MKKSQKTLCISIGGLLIKGAVVNESGKLLTKYLKFDTPPEPTPANVLKVIDKLAKASGQFQNISVGFPGYVSKGKVITAPNLGTVGWQNIKLSKKISVLLGKPCQVINDADMQGLGVAKGKGFEVVATFSIGFGTAFLFNGKLLPNVDLAHHPIIKGKTYDEYIGQKAYDICGKKKWNKRMEKILEVIKIVFNYDFLYLGGGNASKLDFPLDKNIRVVGNIDGIKGGVKLWH